MCLPPQSGNAFSARQSYLAQEISWSCHFQEVVRTPAADDEEQRYSVDLDQ